MKNVEYNAAFAAMAAVAGVGFSTGRAISLFFAQFGPVSRIGAAVASALFGLMCALFCRLGKATGQRSLSGVFTVLSGPRTGFFIGLLHDILLSLAAGMMLAAAGEAALLALPVHSAFSIGMLAALLLSLLLNLRNTAALSGLTFTAMCLLFYGALLLDPRPVQIHMHYVTVPVLTGSLFFTLLSAVLHASLNASLAAGVLLQHSGHGLNCARTGTNCGLLMLALTGAANESVLRGGNRLLSQPIPSVVLAARMGVWGYRMSVFCAFLFSAFTLSAALGALLRAGHRRSAARFLLMAACCIFAMRFGVCAFP